VLLYDPRKLAAPVARLDAGTGAAAADRPSGGPSAAAAIAALHWQHTDAEIEARRAAPAATPLPAAEAAATPRIDLPLAPVRAGIVLRTNLPGACLRLSCRFRCAGSAGADVGDGRLASACARDHIAGRAMTLTLRRGRRGSRRPLYPARLKPSRPGRLIGMLRTLRRRPPPACQQPGHRPHWTYSAGWTWGARMRRRRRLARP